VRDGTAGAEAIGFGMGEKAEAVRRAGQCAMLFVPTRNEWNGAARLQLKLKAIRRVQVRVAAVASAASAPAASPPAASPPATPGAPEGGSQ
jgi:hypothetical protein